MSSQLKVNSISDAAGANGNAITLATDGTCTAKVTNNLSNRNLIINGSCIVAQRSSSATGNGCLSVDRWLVNLSGHQELATQAQHALTSSDTGPWEKGFRKSFHVTNGNQTGGAGADDIAYVEYRIEAQDIANSGWNYNSTSSYITLSFWVKSSVAGQQYGYLYTADGTSQGFSFSVGNLSANTWSKVTVKIPGNANLTFDDNNAAGLYIYWGPFWGTDYTASGNTLNTWAAYSGSSRTPDFPSTWWTTNDATFELTGVQLEVSDYATDFEHRSFGDELFACQRYYCQSSNYGTTPADGSSSSTALLVNAAANHTLTETIPFLREMRAAPTVTAYEESSAGGGSSGQWAWYIEGSWNYFSMTPTHIRTRHFAAAYNSYTGGSDGDTYMGHINWKAEAEL